MPSVDSNAIFAKRGGSWTLPINVWSKHGGSWKKPLGVWVKKNGSWVKVWDERPNMYSISQWYVEDTSGFIVTTTYYRLFNIAANGFETTLTGSGGFVGVSFSQTTIPANTDGIGILSSSGQFGYYNPSHYHTVTATNASGSTTF